MLSSRMARSRFMTRHAVVSFMGGKPHHRFFGRVGAVELALQLAFSHHEDAIGEREDLGQIARHHEHGEPVARLLPDHLVDLELGADVDALGRLVEQQHARLGRQPLGDDDLLLVAAAERVGRTPRCRRP